MELKLHSDDDGFKSAELVSATLPKGSVSSLRLKGSYKMCAEAKDDCTVADVQHNESRPKEEHL